MPPHRLARARKRALGPNPRPRRGLRIAFVLACLLPWPLLAHGQTPPPDDAALTPPQLREDAAPTLPELPPGSESVSVVLELTVDTEGVARDPIVLSSAGDELDRAALAAVAALRFTPALRGETPIDARIPFRFTFQPAPPPAPPPPPAPAAQQEQLSDELTLDVQGEKPPREPTVYSLDTSEARKMPGTNGDPLRAIESLPGVARPPAADGTPIVRGSAPNDTAIFIDGISIPIAYHFGGISAVVPNDTLARLDFRPGNFGAEYGRAMGGVIDLGLRAPRRDRIGGLVQLDPIDGRLSLEGPLGSRTRFMLAARRSWVDAWIGKVSDNIKSAPVYYDAQAVLEHDLTRRTTARLFFFAADDQLKLLFDTPSAADPSEGGKFELGTRFTRLGLRFDSKLSDNVNLRTTFAWGTDRFVVHQDTTHQDIRDNSLNLRSELRTRWADWITSTIGVDAQVSKYHVGLNVRPYESTDQVESPEFGRPTRAFDERVWLVRPAAYALLEITPVEGLRIVPGVRADYALDTKQLTIDPRVNVRADVHPSFPRTTLKGGVGMYSQPPQGVESVEPFGTKGVESNRALHTSFGFEQELARGLELSLEGFYKHLTHLVVARPGEDTDNVGAHFANTGSGRAYGGEALLRYRDRDDRYFAWLAYTLSRSERRNDSDESYHLFQYDQTHILTALGNFQIGRGFSAGARFRYVTGSPYTPYVGGVLDLDAGAYAPVPGPTYGARLPAFHQLDLRVDKTWSFGVRKLIAYLELRNAYNRQNSEQLTYRFDYSASKRASGLPILPVIGLRGEL